MKSLRHHLLEQALQLPLDERAELASEILASLDGEPEPGAEEAWAREIERRAARVLSGESEGIPWEDVRQRIEREVLHR
ncbi:MAG TPA: addiction module protein [Thermoanaerobaculia bacterium]|nr:addiction module protein [Thermoanaerobaculia bacterium]